MSILEYNGSALIAMTGKGCVAIASDNRFGRQQQTVATNMQKIFKVHDQLYMGISGLVTDMQTFWSRVVYQIRMYELREERVMKPDVFSNLVSGLLYKQRFGPWFIEPVVAGLDSKGVPYINAMDLLGAPVTSEGFVVAGSSAEQLYGMCESLYRPDMEADDLFETVSQALLAAQDRDCLAGWGATVIIITPDSCLTRQLKARPD